MIVTTETRHLTASLVVVDPDACEVLLVHHNATGTMMFPGGHIDADESPAEAAVREVLEETGIHAEIVHQTALDLPGMVQLPTPWLTYEIPAPAKPRKGEPAHSHIDLLFLAVASTAQQPRPLESEVARAEWIRIPQLPGLDCRAEVPTVALRAWRLLTGRDGQAQHTGLSVTGSGTVTMSHVAIGHGATVYGG